MRFSKSIQDHRKVVNRRLTTALLKILYPEPRCILPQARVPQDGRCKLVGLCPITTQFVDRTLGPVPVETGYQARQVRVAVPAQRPAARGTGADVLGQCGRLPRCEPRRRPKKHHHAPTRPRLRSTCSNRPLHLRPVTHALWPLVAQKAIDRGGRPVVSGQTPYATAPLRNLAMSLGLLDRPFGAPLSQSPPPTSACHVQCVTRSVSSASTKSTPALRTPVY